MCSGRKFVVGNIYRNNAYIINITTLFVVEFTFFKDSFLKIFTPSERNSTYASINSRILFFFLTSNVFAILFGTFTQTHRFFSFSLKKVTELKKKHSKLQVCTSFLGPNASDLRFKFVRGFFTSPENFTCFLHFI